MLTADTITDKQIRALRDSDGGLPTLRLCAEALSPEKPGDTRRHHSRARCAEILNTRNGRLSPKESVSDQEA